MQYASRAIQLAKEIENRDFEPEFETILKNAPTNEKEFANGKAAYEDIVKTSTVDLNRVAVHFAISSIFTDHPQERRAFTAIRPKPNVRPGGGGNPGPCHGQNTVKSAIVLEEYTVDFAALYRGDPYIIAAGKGRMSDSLFSCHPARFENRFSQRGHQRGDTPDEYCVWREQLFALAFVQG